MGGGSSSDTKTTQNTQTNMGPWAPQQGYLSNGFIAANTNYDNAMGNQYSGNFVAQPTSDQSYTFNNLLSQAGGLTPYSANQSDLVGGQASQAGTNAGINATNGLFGLAGANNTGNIINQAGQYMNSAPLQGAIQAALTPAQQQLNEQTLPSIDRQAGAEGNINSSRAGVAQGIAERGYMQTAANTAASMENQAYNTGISAAQNTAGQNAGILSSAGGLGNQQLSTGLYGIGNASNIMNTGTNAANLASQNVTANNQAPLTNALDISNYAQNNPSQMLQNYWNIVGSNNWGQSGTQNSQGTSQTQQNPSLLSSIGSGLGILGSLFPCDRNIKDNIRLIGRTPDGVFPLYSFTYKNDPSLDLYEGPMAQDVEEIYPNAIVTIAGIKHIDTGVYSWMVPSSSTSQAA